MSVADFRAEAARALPRREADQLIDLCQNTSAPPVSFQTAELKKPGAKRWEDASQKQRGVTGAPSSLPARLVPTGVCNQTADRGLGISRSEVSKIEARLSYVDDKASPRF